MFWKGFIKTPISILLMNYKNLVFLGTSHIAKQSLDEVKQYIEKEKPEIIAIELDAKRLPFLGHGQRKSLASWLELLQVLR